MRPAFLFSMASILAISVLQGCSTAPVTVSEREDLQTRAQQTIEQFKMARPALAERYLQESAGYAVIPTVGKGGFGIGGAYGKGVLYENPQPNQADQPDNEQDLPPQPISGYVDMTQASIGFLVGGQAYSEIIFFDDQRALDEFKNNAFELTADAHAVAANAGASATAERDVGVTVFVFDQEGLMVDASVAGQRFTYLPTSTVDKMGQASAQADLP